MSERVTKLKEKLDQGVKKTAAQDFCHVTSRESHTSSTIWKSCLGELMARRC